MKFFYLTLTLLFSLSSFASDYLSMQEYNEIRISWDSKEAQKRLLTAEYKQDFFALAHNFEPQINPLYCGIASSVIILNSLKKGYVEIPSQTELEVAVPEELGLDFSHIAFQKYAQETFLNKTTNTVKEKEIIDLKAKNDNGKYDPGLTLMQLKRVMELYDIQADLFYADNKELTSDSFRDMLISTLNNTDNFIVANFYGRTIGNSTFGHIAPIAAFDKKTDSILVLDVAGHKNPWYWVNLTDFFKAMNTKDGDNFRGLLLVENS